jgi:Methyltransferase domain
VTTPTEAYAINSSVWNDIQDHLPLLHSSARGNVLEIGVRGGASTSALLSGVEKHGGHLWSVDVNPCRIFEHPQWTFIQADSIKEAEKILAEIPDELDVLFVDGDHSYEGCLSDLNIFGPRSKQIFVHDCECPDTFPGVRQAFDEFAAKWAKASTVISGSYGMGVIEMCRIQKDE